MILSAKRILLTTLFMVAVAAGQSSPVYVGNKPLIRDAQSGTVSVIHFIRLLEPKERERVRLEGSALILTSGDGQAHRLPVEGGKLTEWPRALELLGYARKENSETGVVDYRTAWAIEKLNAGPVDETPQVKLERSLRRPAYRTAKKTYEEILRLQGRSSDEEARRRVDKIGQLVVLQSPLSGLLWNFDVIETPIPNALCTGEGHVLVTTGLLALGLTDDELAGVLGHEVAHGVRRHAQIYEERFEEFVTVRNEILTASREFQVASDSGANYQIQRLRSRVTDLKKRYDFLLDYLKKRQDYNQDEEEESDVLGMQYAAAAGFDPQGEARALIKLKARSVELFGQAYSEGNRTHPPLERRLMILQTVQRRWREERR